MLALFAAAGLVKGEVDEADLSGFHGKLSRIQIAEKSQPENAAVQEGSDSDLDLKAMAQWAMQALEKNPRPNLNYECRFSMSLLKDPPCPGPTDHDPITAGDTENRLDWEFGYMKDITGDTSADAIARGLRRRILGFLRDDGLCWVQASSFSSLPGIWANSWTTGKLLISLSNVYRRTHDEDLRRQCRQMFEALRARADWVDGRAYYAGGNSCWNNQGWAITDASPYSPAMPLEAIATYYEAFGDKEALEFALAFARGEMACDQWKHWILRDPSKLTQEQKDQIKRTSSIALWPTAPLSANLMVRPDGSFDHHSHMRGHSGWGMAHVAYLTRDPELIAWCQRLLNFFLEHGTDYGWIPESQTYPRRSETCAVADVIDIAAYMAKCGYPNYWDTVERFIRNYIREAQFFITPDYEKLYRTLHPGAEGDNGLAMARALQGGFQGAMGVNDRCYAGNEMDMMGCCFPEGMRALHTAWLDTVTSRKDGVYVNMSFNRDAPEAKTISFLPHHGRLTVLAKKSGDFYLRPPAWAPQDMVKIYRNGKSTRAIWRGAYVHVRKVNKGDKLDLTYPLISFVQKQIVKNAPGEPDRNITVTWLGNTVMKLEPPGSQLPLYQQVPRPLPAIPK
ncbi:MAG: glycoside hydrolase family 127 protein [Candidatus Omnitrophica bacterium]|nr:glycoside hydrolase family 127 protein [Candidatus Omnitrophota bacterium]